MVVSREGAEVEEATLAASKSQSTGATRTIPGSCRREFMPLDEGKGTPPPQRLSCVFERNALGHDLHRPTNVNT